MSHDSGVRCVHLAKQYASRVQERAFAPTRRDVLHWTSWMIALGIEVALLFALQSGRIFAWEVSLTRAFQDLPIPESTFRITSAVTNTLSWPFVAFFAVVVVVAWALGLRRGALLLLLSFPLHVLAQFPKALVDRERPSAAFAGIEGAGGTRSFPSGHAEFVVTFYGFLAFLLWSRYRGRGARAAILVSWLGLVAATGFGRVAAGRHWPLDVLASYVVGAGLLSGLIWLDLALRPAEPNATRQAEYTG